MICVKLLLYYTIIIAEFPQIFLIKSNYSVKFTKWIEFMGNYML